MLLPPDPSLVEVSLVFFFFFFFFLKKDYLSPACSLKVAASMPLWDLTHDCGSDAECLQGVSHPFCHWAEAVSLTVFIFHLS